MRLLCPIFIALWLGACTGLDTTRSTIASKGAAAADQVLVDAEWTICYAATVGSIKRKYGQTIERAATYQRFCDGQGANVIAPNGFLSDERL